MRLPIPKRFFCEPLDPPSIIPVLTPESGLIYTSTRLYQTANLLQLLHSPLPVAHALTHRFQRLLSPGLATVPSYLDPSPLRGLSPLTPLRFCTPVLHLTLPLLPPPHASSRCRSKNTRLRFRVLSLDSFYEFLRLDRDITIVFDDSSPSNLVVLFFFFFLLFLFLFFLFFLSFLLFSIPPPAWVRACPRRTTRVGGAPPSTRDSKRILSELGENARFCYWVRRTRAGGSGREGERGPAAGEGRGARRAVRRGRAQCSMSNSHI